MINISIVKHIDQALLNAHKAKSLLQEYEMPKEQIELAKGLLIDLKQTIQSLEGQIREEERNGRQPSKK